MDIRELYSSMSPEDKILYQVIRTSFRKIYLSAHNNIIGMDNWDNGDDALLDLLDIKIAVLFDRAGRIEGTKPLIDKEKVSTIENNIKKEDEKITTKMETEMSEASQKLASIKPNGNYTW